VPERAGDERIDHHHNQQLLIMSTVTNIGVTGKAGKPATLTGALGMLMRATALILFLGACDIVEAPYIEKHDDGGPVSDNPRKVLLLDLTGHTCKSCPKAHKTIEQLKELYGDRLAPVAFHMGYFAKPQSTGKFTTDFRTPEGTVLESYFECVSFPNGTVQTLSNESLQPYASWPAAVSEAITGDSPVKIEITPQYLPGLNALVPKIKITALETVTGPLKLAVYLVEDGIVDWQKDEDFDPMDIPDYVHNHVFRTSMCGVWGERVGNDDGMTKGYTVEPEYSKILDSAWNVGNCSLIAFVYHEDSKVVVQAEMRKAQGAGLKAISK
jgi:hypothetical protein